MNPFYFGSSKSPLFGVHHPPKARTPRNAGVVLCAPFGQEYMRSHRAFRQLAMLLSRAGFHVLRFDYSATGDSAGESTDGDVTQWAADIGTAVEELKDMANLKRVSLVGLRLGAALAAIAERGRTDVDALVLWDPAVDGKRYLAEILTPAVEHASAGAKAAAPGPDEVIGVLGFPVTPRLREGISKINLLAEPAPRAKRVLVITSDESADAARYREHAASGGSQATYQCIATGGNWNEVDNYGSALIPQEIIKGIVTFFGSGA